MATPEKNSAPTNEPATAPQSKAIARAEQSMSVRFMNKVVTEFGSSAGAIALTEFQQRLVQNYFIYLDGSLRAADEKRIKNNFGKEEKYKNTLPITWANMNMEGLARSVVACARIGLDPAQKNHVNLVPYKNNATGKYEIVVIEGYRGIELKATKYGLDVPDAVVVELVYTKDHFKAIKKSLKNSVETYEFEVIDAFDRGEIKGGFYYHVFAKNPEKNKLVVFNIAQIEKRKPRYASTEFWGGEKDVWENKKKVGTEHVDGWYDKMCWKTVFRAAWADITIDSQKINDDYLLLKQNEALLADATIAAEIAENANTGEVLKVEDPVIDGEFTADELESTPGTTKGQSAPPPSKDQEKPDF